MVENNRTAVVIGAAQGIGRRAAEVLAQRGYCLALIDLRMPDETIQSIRSGGGEAMAYTGNITDELAVEGFARAVRDACGRAGVLVSTSFDTR